MEIRPSLDRVLELCSKGKYGRIPVSCEILSDVRTPIEVLRILKGVSRHCYMLESASEHQTWGRYSFLGFDPGMEITCRSGLFKAVFDAIADLVCGNDSPCCSATRSDLFPRQTAVW